MPRKQRLIQLPLTGKIFLCVLAGVYLLYLGMFGRSLYPALFAPTIIEHPVHGSFTSIAAYWTTAHMLSATDVDQQIPITPALTQDTITSQGQPARQRGQLPSNDPRSTVGKLFFTSGTGQNMACSGTAVISQNQSVVDTAGHCLYLNNTWSQNVFFCPLYYNGHEPHGCWDARDLEVPVDWINARPNDLHHDFGMVIVAPNRQGTLTHVMGGVGWAYNQPVKQPFSAYGYPTAAPFDGEARQSCENATGRVWQHGGGIVIAIPCNMTSGPNGEPWFIMTGGSSGGPWFIQIDGNWYLNGHNDFISSLQPGHVFSPYYDDTWYALYEKAQNT